MLPKTFVPVAASPPNPANPIAGLASLEPESEGGFAAKPPNPPLIDPIAVGVEAAEPKPSGLVEANAVEAPNAGVEVGLDD